MSTPTPTPYVFSSSAHQHLIPYLAALHGSCITNDRMSGSFLPPLNHEKLLTWWRDRIAEVAAGTRVIIILLGESEPGSKAKGSELIGVVMLGMPLNETSTHAAFLENLFVSPKMRRQGGAKTLIGALEYEAVQRGRTLLVSRFVIEGCNCVLMRGFL